VLGTSRDDAAGEAFDKTAKLLGLPYPGGPQLAQLAERGTPGAFSFPRPMLDRAGLEFSFSGLKTAGACTRCRGRSLTETQRADVACGVQEAIVETLTAKALRALEYNRAHGAGGVRRRERQSLFARAAHRGRRQPRRPRVLSAHRVLHRQRGDDCWWPGWRVSRPGEHDSLAIQARARWPLESLPALPERIADMSDSRHTDDRIFLHGLDHRVHHRLCRLGAPRQADRGSSTSSCRWTAGARRSATRSATQLDYRGWRSGCWRSSKLPNSNSSRPSRTAWRCIILGGVRRRLGAHRAQQAPAPSVTRVTSAW